jgi:ABC-type Fe3+ transport system permease subunit
MTNPQRNSIAALGFSTWFALLSPVIGVLLGLFGAFLFLR